LHLKILDAYNKNKKLKFFTDILEKYTTIFNKTKSYNPFFVRKIEDIILQNTPPYQFEKFIEEVDKKIISTLRPSINSFIIEINKILLERYKVILFIAGGDAMRRYKEDITVTKDIDVKLYINNIDLTNIPNDLKEKHADKHTNWDDINTDVKKQYVKYDIIDIIAKTYCKPKNTFRKQYKKFISK